jgi:hypothetical protein
MAATVLLLVTHLLLVFAPVPSLQRTTPVHKGNSAAPSALHACKQTSAADGAPPNRRCCGKGQPLVLRSWRLTWCHPDWYWRVPGARNTTVLLMRLATSSVAAIGLGPLRPPEQLLRHHVLAKWPHMVYLWPCWQACCMLVSVGVWGAGSMGERRWLAPAMLGGQSSALCMEG